MFALSECVFGYFTLDCGCIRNCSHLKMMLFPVTIQQTSKVFILDILEQITVDILNCWFLIR